MENTDSRSKSNSSEKAELNEQEFAQLYKNDLHSVLNYVCYRLGIDDAEEITGDIFTRVWESRKKFNLHKGTPKIWLWAIARNAIKDSWRRKKNRPVNVDLSNDLIGDQDTLNEIIKKDEWKLVQEALSHLSTADQEIIALRFGAGLSNKTIGELLQLNDAAVAQRLHRALRKLRIELGEGGFS